MTQINN